MKRETKRNRARASKLVTIVAATFCAASLAGCAMMSKPANDGIADADITSGVEARLAAEPRLEGATIQVATDGGVVHLSGNVATGGDRDAAEKIALESRGVVRVDNYIQFGSRAPIVAQ
jgi:osmotically-inducible protein OsmY